MAVDVAGCGAVVGEKSACTSANRFHSVRPIEAGAGELPECGSIAEKPPEISSKILRHGGARVNAGGARPNSGGARKGAGRKPGRVVWAAVAPPRVEGGTWHAVECEPGVDLLVINRLMAEGVEVLAPKHRPDPKREERPALGRYVLVRFDLAAPDWRRLPAMLRECRARLLGEDGERPATIPDAAVERLLAQLEADGGAKRAPRAPRLRPGERVRVLGGLLGSVVGEGVVEWASHREARVAFGGGAGVVVARALLQVCA